MTTWRQLTLDPSQRQTCDIPIQRNNYSSHDSSYQSSKLNVCQGYPYPNVSCMILISCWHETEISALGKTKFSGTDVQTFVNIEFVLLRALQAGSILVFAAVL